MRQIKLTCGLIASLMLVTMYTSAQDVPIDEQKFIYFPHPLNAPNRWSVGVTSTVMPREITEEMHFRIPAIDIRYLKKLTGNVDVDTRLMMQVLQNMLSVGPKWSGRLTDRISMSLGSNLGFFFGRINVQNINTQGYGFQNFPFVAVGFRFNKQLLVSARAEQIMTFGVHAKAGNVDVKSDYRLWSGSAYTIAFEQPFAGNKSVTLGFRALYTDYYWQTWTLFENYDRNLFFPQLIIGLIL